MTQSAKSVATYEDILALPEHLVGEILSGTLYSHPQPAPRHARAYSWVTGTLWGPFDNGSGGPDARTQENFHLQENGHWLLLAILKDDDPATQPPFDAITFPLNTLWAD